MPQLIYLSTAKLNQFDFPRRRPWWRKLYPKRSVTIGLATAEVAFGEAVAESEQRLRADEAIAYLPKEGRKPRRPSDLDLEAGEWIAFEARFNLHIPGDEIFQSAVFFLEFGQSASGPDQNATRLLLHGSSRHLNINSPDSDAPAGGRASSGSLFEELAVDDRFQRVIDDMLRIEQVSGTHTDPAEAGEATLTDRSQDWFTPVVSRVVRALESRVSDRTAVWMGGFAQVTAVCQIPRTAAARLVLASPLSVEYIANPWSNQARATGRRWSAWRRTLPPPDS